LIVDAEKRLPFASDYQQGAHPRVLERLSAANMEANAGYGTDAHSEHARELIRMACGAPQAEVHFLVGGTQANAVAIDALLAPWQGVVAADSGHVSIHEAGAIEACGHKVIQLPSHDGKLDAADVNALAASWEQDENRDHMVMPGLVYISQPTEYGTLYSLDELSALRAACDAHGMRALRRWRAPCLRACRAEKQRAVERSGAPGRRVLHWRHQVRRASRRSDGLSQAVERVPTSSRS
jgi:threonine aldolase